MPKSTPVDRMGKVKEQELHIYSSAVGSSPSSASTRLCFWMKADCLSECQGLGIEHYMSGQGKMLANPLCKLQVTELSRIPTLSYTGALQTPYLTCGIVRSSHDLCCRFRLTWGVTENVVDSKSLAEPAIRGKSSYSLNISKHAACGIC